jgi:hypothetical protein
MFHRNAHITFPCVFHTSSANRNPIEEQPSEKASHARELGLRGTGFRLRSVASRRVVPCRAVLGCVRVALSHCLAAV